MEMRCKKVLDDLLINQEKLTKIERVKVFGSLSNDIFPKTKIERQIHLRKIKREKRRFL
jgi:hypothetical protein